MTKNIKNVLFLTMYKFTSLSDSGIYEDLMREFVNNNKRVFVVSPIEKKDVECTFLQESHESFKLLRVQTGELQKNGFIKKGIATLQVASLFKKAILNFFPKVEFDLILYSTPPITLCDTVRYFKERDKASTFLLLKDIFPQNAADIGILKMSGLKGAIYNFFRKKEKRLYDVSDYIGCMSQANKDYIIAHNTEIKSDNVTIVPNSIEPKNVSIANEERVAMREKYGLPLDKTVFVYGGNLGKPQDVPFIIECLKTQTSNKDAYFLIVGDGTEYGKFETFMEKEGQPNVKVLRRLPREDFDTMLAACDVGMIFLDHRFSIPNYPSRLLSYMQAGLPVLACTDPNTDVGKDIVDNGFGWWCESDNVEVFNKTIQQALSSDLKEMSLNSLKYLREHFTVQKAYKNIMTTLCGDKL